MARSEKSRKPKPSRRVDRRKTTSTRIRPEVRSLLEQAASQSHRSLAQEIELRLEQSFLDEEARDREWGGKRLHGLFRMMAGAFEIVEESRAKACTADWGTFSAVKDAWELLLFTSLAPKDQPYGDHLEAIGGPPEDFEMPPDPTPPKHPMADRWVLAPSASESAKKLAAYEKKCWAYEKECVRWRNKADEYREKLDAVQQHRDEMKNLGTKTVLEMFSTNKRG